MAGDLLSCGRHGMDPAADAAHPLDGTPRQRRRVNTAAIFLKPKKEHRHERRRTHRERL